MYLIVLSQAFGWEFLDLYGWHNVADTSADIPSHILSIVLYAERRVLQSGCSFEHPSLSEQVSCRMLSESDQTCLVTEFVCFNVCL